MRWRYYAEVEDPVLRKDRAAEEGGSTATACNNGYYEYGYYELKQSIAALLLHFENIYRCVGK